jgi:hypothetical protein
MRFWVTTKVRKLGLLSGLLLALTASILAQTIVDKSVATVSDGVRTELITYSDLLWQLALQPGTSVEQPSSEDLNRALQLQINQRLFALEAERLPREAPTQAELDREIADLLAFFPSTAEFERRLRTVGFTSVKDENFVNIIRQRLSIDKYLTFRFRSFTVITPEDQTKYYNDIFVPEFRRKYPGVVVPSLAEKQAEITNILTEQRVAADIEAFLDEAKRRAEIVILSDV